MTLHWHVRWSWDRWADCAVRLQVVAETISAAPPSSLRSASYCAAKRVARLCTRMANATRERGAARA